MKLNAFIILIVVCCISLFFSNNVYAQNNNYKYKDRGGINRLLSQKYYDTIPLTSIQNKNTNIKFFVSHKAIGILVIISK